MDRPLTDEDLKANKYAYDEETIIKNINTLSLFWILITQKVSAEFCVKYVWDLEDKYAKDTDDEEIYLHNILDWQPHLTKEDIHTCPEYLRRIAVANEKNKNNNSNDTSKN
jgi:hypothetical protein